MKTFSRSPDGTLLRHAPSPAGGEWDQLYGRMSIAPSERIIAGTPVELQFDYSCGRLPLEVGDKLGLAWRLPCDWGEPQFDSEASPNFVSASAPPGVSLDLQYQPNGGVKPWHHLFVSSLAEGTLQPGQSARFSFGDRSRGSVGWESQTAMASAHRFMALIRRRGDDHWTELSPMATVSIIGGKAASLAVMAASDCAPGEPMEITVRLSDEWGNPSRGFSGGPDLVAPGLSVSSIERLRREDEEFDVWKARVAFDRPGLHRIVARVPELGLAAESNPVECREAAGGLRLIWGDMHGGQCDLGCGQGSLADYFWYARFVAGLQFASHQANDVYVTREEWQHTRAITSASDAPGEFVAFLGCEWTAQPDSGGDRNVFYLDDQAILHRADRWYQEEEPDDWPDAGNPEELYRCLSDTEALINLHAGGYTSDLDYHDPRLEGLVEVHSTHGTSNWLVEEAIAQGRVFGISAGTDGISGRPGADAPGRRQTRNLRHGCFGVHSPGLSPEEIWESIRARRCYGTDGERIRLMVSCDGHPMGSEIHTSSPPVFDVQVAGTAPLERVLLRCGREIVDEQELWTEDAENRTRYRVIWRGTRRPGTGRDQLLEWTGSLAASAGIALVGPIGYYGHLEGVVQRDPGTIAWRSATAGNPVGFLFDAPSEGSALRFRSAAVEFEVRLPARGTVEQPLPAHSGRGSVTISRAASPRGAREATLAVAHQQASTGTHAYWVEVVQIDGSRAWSSPIYATIG